MTYDTPTLLILLLNKYKPTFPASNHGDLLPSCWSDVPLCIFEN